MAQNRDRGNENWTMLSVILREHNSGIVDNEVYDFLEEIGAPSTLKGIVDVAERIRRIQENGLLRGNEDSKRLTATWNEIVTSISHQRDGIERDLPGIKTKPNAKYLFGYIESNPIYAALWHNAKLEEDVPGADARFLILQSLLLLWYIRIGHDALSMHKRPFAWAVRVLSESEPLVRSILPELPSENESDRQYRRLLQALSNRLRGNGAACTVLEQLEKMVGSLTGDTKLIARVQKGHNPENGKRHIRGDRQLLLQVGHELPVGDEDTGGGILVIREPVDSNGTRRKRLHPDEDANPGRVVGHLRRKHPCDSGHYSRTAYEMSIRHAQAALDRAHNTSHASFQQADPYAIHKLLQYLDESRQIESADSLEKFGIALTLFTAQSPDVIATMTIDRLAAVLPDAPRYPRIYLKAKRIIFEGPTKIAFRNLKDPGAQHRPVANYVILALPRLVEAYCHQVVEMRMQDGRAKVLHAFKNDQNSLERRMKKSLNAIGTRIGYSLTLGQLRRCLFNRLRNHPCGDHVKAAMLCDYISSISKNPMHYRWVSLDQLYALHHAVSTDIEGKKR